MTTWTDTQREDLIAKYNEMRRDGAQREGQALMNALYFIDAEMYDEIHGTDADCFYSDDKILAFFRRTGLV